MTEDIEELKEILDILLTKLKYFESKKDQGMIKRLNKNINKVSKKIKEIENR